MMKKSFLYLFLIGILAGLATACENDDTDFSAYSLKSTDNNDDDDTLTTVRDTIYITYIGSSVTVTSDTYGYVSVNGADVTVTDTQSDSTMVLVLSGSTSDGSLLVYRQKKYTIILNGVTINNPDGPAINNQCKKSLTLVCADGTTNTLTDGTSYAFQDFDQKGTLFSEGQISFCGSGTLNVNGNCKNAIASDDYITIDDDIVINATTSSTGSNGIKANDGMFIYGGTLTIDVASDGGRGINSDARTTIAGGNITITTSGDCKTEMIDGVDDVTSAACIKCDSLFSMTAGTLTVTSTGDGGKGINCDANIEISGGTLVAKTTGSNDMGKPKAVKSDTGIILSGGSFTATVKKSWACDNGNDSDEPADHLTILGTPTSSTIEKKSVIVIY